MLGAAALLSGCGKEKPLVLPANVVTATAGVGAVSDATACSEFAAAFQQFQAGTLPNNGTGDGWSELADVLDPVHLSAFEHDIAQVDTDCGRTFAPLSGTEGTAAA